MRPRLLGEGTPTILGLRTMALAAADHPAKDFASTDGTENSKSSDSTAGSNSSDNSENSASFDCTVSLASVSDRLARLDETDVELPLPTVTVNESWAALSAPRSDWLEQAVLASETLIAVAKEGVREIAQIIPVNPGALIVNNARASVWGRAMANYPELPGGAAFAGFALGFWAPQSQVRLYRSGRWLRLSSPAGHVLIRPAAAL